MRLLPFLLLLAGCANAWRALTDPGHYGTAYQRREYQHALPCKNWCVMSLHIPWWDREDMLVIREGLTCLCVVHPVTTPALTGTFDPPGPWLRSQMPVVLLPLLEDDSPEGQKMRDVVAKPCP